VMAVLNMNESPFTYHFFIFDILNINQEGINPVKAISQFPPVRQSQIAERRLAGRTGCAPLSRKKSPPALHAGGLHTVEGVDRDLFSLPVPPGHLLLVIVELRIFHESQRIRDAQEVLRLLVDQEHIKLFLHGIGRRGGIGLVVLDPLLLEA